MTPAGGRPAWRTVTVLAGLGLAAAAATVAVAGGSAWSAAASPATRPGSSLAVAARTCPRPHYPSVGYFDSIVVTGTSCATGRRFVLAFYKCRTASGLAGRCRKPVLGFRCTETRMSIPSEIDARDTCTRGRATIVSVWQQDITS